MDNEQKKILKNKQAKLTEQIKHDIMLENICKGNLNSQDAWKLQKVRLNNQDVNMRYCKEKEI